MRLSIEELKAVMVMVAVQIGYAGMNIFYKLAANDGMDLRVLVAYRCIFATAFVSPLALILERKRRPKLTWTVLFQAFLCALVGLLLAQNLYVEALALTSATFVVAMFNLVPAFTLILAILFRLDRLEVKTATGRAKLIGIVTGIGGAMVLTFYKGVEINIWSTDLHLLKHTHHHHQNSHGSTRILGCFLSFFSCITYALWLILQTKMSKRYPCHYSSTALVSIMGSIQCVILSLCMERNWSQWKLGWNIRLLAVAYVGFVTSGVALVLIAWCVNKRGPVFVASFNPLALLIVAIAGSIMLEEKLHLGSIMGAVFTVCGLYILVWGQSKEMKDNPKLMATKSSHESGLMEINVTNGVHTSSIASTHEGIFPKNTCSQPTSDRVCDTQDK